MSSLPEKFELATALLSDTLTAKRYGDVAAVSSFGAESAVLLHLIAQVDTAAPVFFIDTRMLFQETLDYKILLTRHLALSDVRTVSPAPAAISEKDIWGRMHKEQPDACCDFRKTAVLDEALAPFDGWITGRKRHQAFTRSYLKPVETTAEGKTKINPLADWSSQEIVDYMQWFDLPQHPLVNHGYASIGCATCTSPVKPGEDARAGRWRGMGKTECGIHIDGANMRQGNTNNVR